jgi:hypothetical protein
MTHDPERRARPRTEDPGLLDETPEQEAEFRTRIMADLDARIARADAARDTGDDCDGQSAP